MRMSTLIIGILIVGFIVTGFYAVVNEMAAEDDGYDVEIDDSYTDAFEKSDNVSAALADDYQEIMNFSANKGSTIGIVTLVPDVLSLLKNMITLPLTLVEGMVTSIVEYLKLPTWVTTLFLVIFTAVAIFAFAALVLRYKDT